ncbi:unnamed protein product [Paramecium sonneborni]|uniref:Protein kinase domain-containing protein n=1 Tax=Paramecium sonneborni TaxID=65129 RepID=A0A8S1RDV4_9CILI|nr:unnamed protein product [Paramecium sonneborni]
MDQNSGDKQYIQGILKNQEGQIIEYKFERGQLLQQTQFGDFYKFSNIDLQEVLIAKIIPKSKITTNRIKQQVLQEIRIYQKITHQNILKFCGTFEDKDYLYILLEDFQQSLCDYLRQQKNISEDKAILYFAQIVDALYYLHENNIMHRDLKLSNIYFTKDQQLKIGGFNYAIQLEQKQERRKSICGTSQYLAPDILQNEDGYSLKVDIWYLGIILYRLLYSVHPFQADDIKSAYQNIKTTKYKLREEVKISQNIKDLIDQLLNADPNKRPSIEKIREFCQVLN